MRIKNVFIVPVTRVFLLSTVAGRWPVRRGDLCRASDWKTVMASSTPSLWRSIPHEPFPDSRTDDHDFAGHFVPGPVRCAVASVAVDGDNQRLAGWRRFRPLAGRRRQRCLRAGELCATALPQSPDRLEVFQTP